MKAAFTLLMFLLIALTLSASSSFAGHGTEGATGGPGHYSQAVGMDNGHFVERQPRGAATRMDGCRACCPSAAGFGCCTGVAVGSEAPALTAAIAGVRPPNGLLAAAVSDGIHSLADQRPPRA